MNWYLFVFIWLGLMVLAERLADLTVPKVQFGKRVHRWRLVYALLAFWPILYLAAFTKPIGDVPLYLYLYQNSVTTGRMLLSLRTLKSGFMWDVFEWVCKYCLFLDETGFRLFLALLHSIPVLYVYRKYSSNFLLSLFLFAASGCHIAWMMNGLRQFLAASIILAATPLMLKKKYIPLIAIILFAATFHTSALLMVPVVFIVQGKPWGIRTLLLILGAVALTMLFGSNAELLDEMLVNTEYSGVMEVAQEMGDDGVNPIRVLVNSMPLILAFLGREVLAEDKNPMVDLCINMSVITFGINLIAMVTSGIMMGRLALYTDLYSCILLPYAVSRVFTPRSAPYVQGAMIGFYFLYYLYGYGGMR